MSTASPLPATSSTSGDGARPDRRGDLLRPPLPGGDATLALHGADLVAHPTNFPVAAKVQTEIITLARAAENRIYLLTANRVERSGEASSAVTARSSTPWDRLGEADPTEETLLFAEVDVERARDKDYVIPGEYELYLFGHRRPELYGAVVEENATASDKEDSEG